MVRCSQILPCGTVILWRIWYAVILLYCWILFLVYLLYFKSGVSLCRRLIMSPRISGRWPSPPPRDTNTRDLEQYTLLHICCMYNHRSMISCNALASSAGELSNLGELSLGTEPGSGSESHHFENRHRTRFPPPTRPPWHLTTCNECHEFNTFKKTIYTDLICTFGSSTKFLQEFSY